MYDKYTPFHKINYGFDFTFHATKCKKTTVYEETTLLCNIQIMCLQITDGSVIFKIENNLFDIKSELLFDIVYTSTNRFYCATVPEETNINSSYDFLRFKANAPLGFNMITRKCKDFDFLEPYVCSVFTINSVIKKLAFRFENPVKILEFE